ncbi:thiol-disulfide oxidoreductase DCC family protein [Photobacterium sp. DNB22_13_2]
MNEFMVMLKGKLTIFYDGSCSSCVDDRDWFIRQLSRPDNVDWCDITGQDDYLKSLGIDPYLAVKELHVMNVNGEIHKELDAYILLFRQVWYLRPLVWVMAISYVKRRLSRWYRKTVDRRLAAQGRVDQDK